MAGATLGPDAAYRLARGDEVESHSGLRVRLVRPLDFLVVSDHAENLALADYLEHSDSRLLGQPTGRRWHDWFHGGKSFDVFAEWTRAKEKDLIDDLRLKQDAWRRVIANAELFYEPRAFSTFAAFEWTSQPQGNCLHRVVLFRDGPERTGQSLPFSRFDSSKPEDLWRYLEAYEQGTKGRVLAIPHGGNLSNGALFDERSSDGRTVLPDDAIRRRHFEPLYEVTQMKGDSEAHPALSPHDEFADFETLDTSNQDSSAAKTPDMLPGEYARSALMRGLRLERLRGHNPFQFGMVGGTDAHTALSTTREENFFGAAHLVEPNPERLGRVLSGGDQADLSLLVRELSASGLTAVWAPENTREALFDSLARREVYATTGTRLRVRVFAGYALQATDLHRPDFVRIGYAKGVPMGGELHAAPFGQSLRLLVRAERDPDGANLDRIQVIKGFLDSSGQPQERIFDVAVSGARKIQPNGRCRESVGSTVDVERAAFDNSIGSPILEASFEDPTFDAKQPAFYYVRVIEIPTPRWPIYDRKFFGRELPQGTATAVQERAYSSPIWYLPEQ